MRQLGYTYQYIAEFLKISQRAVQYTCQSEQATPQHRNAGRRPRLSKKETNRVEEFVTRSQRHRQMSYSQVAETLWPENEVGADAIRHALISRGYSRHIALQKPSLSQANRSARLKWAREHILWTKEQWESILWSNKT